MNYLSHQKVAEAVAEAVHPDATARFYIGNVLPDLCAVSGLRVRERALSSARVITPEAVELRNGLRLHIATDARFHSHQSFHSAMAEASELLRAAPFPTPPTRVFFLAHVLVEIALDGLLVTRNPSLADRLYSALESVGARTIAEESASLLGVEEGVPLLSEGIDRFLRARYLLSYRSFDGQATALARVSLRAGVTTLTGNDAQKVLAEVMEAFAPRAERWEPELIAPPPPQENVVVQ